jgi:hypothetical protein
MFYADLSDVSETRVPGQFRRERRKGFLGRKFRSAMPNIAKKGDRMTRPPS